MVINVAKVEKIIKSSKGNTLCVSGDSLIMLNVIVDIYRCIYFGNLFFLLSLSFFNSFFVASKGSKRSKLSCTLVYWHPHVVLRLFWKVTVVCLVVDDYHALALDSLFENAVEHYAV